MKNILFTQLTFALLALHGNILGMQRTVITKLLHTNKLRAYCTTQPKNNKITTENKKDDFQINKNDNQEVFILNYKNKYSPNYNPKSFYVWNKE